MAYREQADIYRSLLVESKHLEYADSARHYFERVVRGISDALNKEALRVIRSLPQWTPGYSNGKPVHTRYTYPVTFKLAKAK